MSNMNMKKRILGLLEREPGLTANQVSFRLLLKRSSVAGLLSDMRIWDGVRAEYTGPRNSARYFVPDRACRTNEAHQKLWSESGRRDDTTRACIETEVVRNENPPGHRRRDTK